MTWMIAIASLLGVVLNVYKLRLCFALWLVSNTSWAIVDFAHGLPAQGALQSVYACLSVWGWFKWKPQR
ncbi:MAG: nicotinamide mononucleotide transporter [Dehalococcoidia bacterium]